MSGATNITWSSCPSRILFYLLCLLSLVHSWNDLVFSLLLLFLNLYWIIYVTTSFTRYSKLTPLTVICLLCAPYLNLLWALSVCPLFISSMFKVLLCTRNTIWSTLTHMPHVLTMLSLTISVGLWIALPQIHWSLDLFHCIWCLILFMNRPLFTLWLFSFSGLLMVIGATLFILYALFFLYHSCRVSSSPLIGVLLLNSISILFLWFSSFSLLPFTGFVDSLGSGSISYMILIIDQGLSLMLLWLSFVLFLLVYSSSCVW